MKNLLLAVAMVIVATVFVTCFFKAPAGDETHHCRYTIYKGGHIYHTCYYRQTKKNCISFIEHDTKYFKEVRVCGKYRIEESIKEKIKEKH